VGNYTLPWRLYTERVKGVYVHALPTLRKAFGIHICGTLCPALNRMSARHTKYDFHPQSDVDFVPTCQSAL